MLVTTAIAVCICTYVHNLIWVMQNTVVYAAKESTTN